MDSLFCFLINANIIYGGMLPNFFFFMTKKKFEYFITILVIQIFTSVQLNPQYPFLPPTPLVPCLDSPAHLPSPHTRPCLPPTPQALRPWPIKVIRASLLFLPELFS